MITWIIISIFTLITGMIIIINIKNRNSRIKKEQKEDIMKFLYKKSKENQKVNFESLQLFSKIKTNKLTKILEEMLKERKIKYDEDNIKLTLDGEKEAKEIIQKHRRIEKYLFEETSIDVEEIHDVAEKQEHNEEIKINTKNTYECIDPHGDIITGQETLSYPLLKIIKDIKNIEQIYKITHIEDEPKEIYKKIVCLDLSPFDYIKIKNISSNSITLLTDKGKIIELDYITAGNIFVNKEENEEITKMFEEIEKNITKITTLNELKLKEKGKIIALSFYIRGEERRRLMELGFIKGSLIEPIYNNMLGKDPRVYKIKNTMIALREEQARKIYVMKVNS